MKTNVKVVISPATHEGGRAARIKPLQELRRSVMACLLWEDSFYESGISIADRIASLVAKVEPSEVAKIAVEAREKMNLRHVPLLLCREMVRLPSHRPYVGDTLARVVQRPDELAEFINLYWDGKKTPLAAQVKSGLAGAFGKFEEYSLAKWKSEEGAVTLRDVMRLVHPKPKDDAQSALWKRLIAGELEIPYTWEVELSKKDDRSKREKWTELLTSGKVPALATLRNLRNCVEAGVEDDLIRYAILILNVRRVLPFRFIAAARYAPKFEPELEQKMFQSVSELKLPGTTTLLVDVSQSMENPLSSKSDMTRLDAACGVAMVAREMSEHVEVYTFSGGIKAVPPRRGFALRDAIVHSQHHGSTMLAHALASLTGKTDRLIVITDEQSQDNVGLPCTDKGYMINVASYQNGVGYGKWLHLDGFSEAVLHYIVEMESLLPEPSPQFPADAEAKD